MKATQTYERQIYKEERSVLFISVIPFSGPCQTSSSKSRSPKINPNHVKIQKHTQNFLIFQKLVIRVRYYHSYSCLSPSYLLRDAHGPISGYYINDRRNTPRPEHTSKYTTNPSTVVSTHSSRRTRNGTTPT